MACRVYLPVGWRVATPRSVGAYGSGVAPRRASHGPREPAAGVVMFVCPCRVCPRCGDIDDDEERQHPEDGLAFGCARCRLPEWWCHVGPPPRDGRCPVSLDEMLAWKAHDDGVLARGYE